MLQGKIKVRQGWGKGIIKNVNPEKREMYQFLEVPWWILDTGSHDAFNLECRAVRSQNGYLISRISALDPSTLLFLPIPSHCQRSCYEKKQWPTHLDVPVPYWAIAECIQVAWPSSTHSLWTALLKLRCQSITVYMLYGHSRSQENIFISMWR